MIRLAIPVLALLAGCAQMQQSPVAAGQDSQACGVLVMAHGGGREWNQGVLEMLKPLRERYNLEVAFGMADAVTIQEGVKTLETRGASKICVVRLFVSGESWYDRTEQILGTRAGAPPRPAKKEDHAGHAGHSMEFWKVDTRAAFALSKEGLAEARETEAILMERANALSRDASKEDVLILAHGPGDDAENARWIANLNARAEAIRATGRFRRVQVETLREDWPEKRKEAEVDIRAYVKRASDTGGQALVVPFRVQGFGPYKKVLEGLDYRSDGVGLVPSPRVAEWVDRQVQALDKGPFASASPGGSSAR